MTTVRQLAAVYVGLLETAALTDVTVVGNSVGGWIAAEMALLGSPRVGSYVLVDAVGIGVPGHEVVDFFALTFPEIAQRSYHNPKAYRIDPDRLPPEAQAAMATNRDTLKLYGGQPSMVDPSLRARLTVITAPVLVVWGDSDPHRRSGVRSRLRRQHSTRSVPPASPHRAPAPGREPAAAATPALRLRRRPAHRPALHRRRLGSDRPRPHGVAQ